VSSSETLRQSDQRHDTLRDVPLEQPSRSAIARRAPIPLRLIVGYGFMEHGFAKLAKGPDASIFTVHLPYGFSSIKLMAVTPAGAQFGPPGYECNLLYLACLAALVFGGSGPLAIDGFVRGRRTHDPIIAAGQDG
jgi:putative oxidoreductase